MFLAWAAGESLLGLGLSLPRADRWPRPGVFIWLSGDQGRSCGSKVLKSQVTMLRGLLSATCPFCPRHCCRRKPQNDRLVTRLPSPGPGTPAAFPGLQLIEVLAHSSLAGSCRVPKVPTQDTPKAISTVSKSQTQLNIWVTQTACPEPPWNGSFVPTLRYLD